MTSLCSARCYRCGGRGLDTQSAAIFVDLHVFNPSDLAYIRPLLAQFIFLLRDTNGAVVFLRGS